MLFNLFFRLSARTANALEIIPQVKVLKHTITKASSDTRFSGLGSTISAISKSMNSRFAKYEENENLIAATFLDPRYKNTLFRNSEEGSKTHLNSIQNFLADTSQKMHKDRQNYEENSSSTDIESETENVREAEANVHDLFDFDSCLNDLLSSAESAENQAIANEKGKLRRQSSSSSSSTLRLKNELEKYSSLQLASREADPLLWWKTNISMFPELAQIANKMLSSPPSSIESERIFSIGGNIFTPHRNRLTPEIGEKLIFLNFNLRVLNFDY